VNELVGMNDNKNLKTKRVTESMMTMIVINNNSNEKNAMTRLRQNKDVNGSNLLYI